jgi:hypothetical protein
MIELSPDAQAIFDAVWNEPTYDPGGWEVSCRIQIAAAFRAAAMRLSYGGAGSYACEACGCKGPIIDECELLAIADQLDPPCEELGEQQEWCHISYRTNSIH